MARCGFGDSAQSAPQPFCTYLVNFALVVCSDTKIVSEHLAKFCIQASSVAEELLKTEYDAARVIYNRFHSAISFKPTIATVLSPDVSQLPSFCHPVVVVSRSSASYLSE